MQANSAEQHSFENAAILGVPSGRVDITALEGYTHDDRIHSEPVCFHSSFTSCMEMYADVATVARYLDAHRAWFPRCAQPMATEPIGDNGYALTIGKFGSFGYEVEPKIGLNLLPADQSIYRIQTIAVPNYVPPGYEVDFKAALQLIEAAPDSELLAAFKKATATAPECVTRVEWQLDLQVMIQFPRFIHALPLSLIETTGDRLLNQIVRQVSRRLTQKVQEDFHSSSDLPFPKKYRKLWQRHPNLQADPQADPQAED
ncbi:MAG: DUF1997 domain-containing protein [Pegethrix bostrychoides GSE-TBD4-15B]|jgi:hypothetical protein|uniref:DUF1997 domain-containing protein n=1 Tax=Pegethrix bostrychoides GSE-TBD4-15B TaxID=2839662 RepID=A0A951PFL7_9CYAN|nr:DUF1997 domain-containing protein [Pegethrix bostrychoides GSE-TBD4-15B]